MISIEHGLQNLLDETHCTEVVIQPVGSHHLMVIFRKPDPETLATLSAPPDHVPAVPGDVGLPGDIPMDTVPGPAPELTVAIAPVDAAAMNEPAIAPPVDLEVIIKSLSIDCAVPCKFDPSFPSSQLVVSKVEKLGDFISFFYCGMLYKCPVYNAADSFGADVCNSGSLNTETIRVVIQVVGSQTSYPVLLSVIDGGSDASVVMLGSDLAEMADAELSGRLSYDSLPTQ
jgi:hypothetical protein